MKIRKTEPTKHYGKPRVPHNFTAGSNYIFSSMQCISQLKVMRELDTEDRGLQDKCTCSTILGVRSS